jgi:hypothetical protein
MNISCRIATENCEGRLIPTNVVDEAALPPFLFVIDPTNLYHRGDRHQNVTNHYMPFKIDISNSTSYVVFITSSDLNSIRNLAFLDIRLCFDNSGIKRVYGNPHFKDFLFIDKRFACSLYYSF